MFKSKWSLLTFVEKEISNVSQGQCCSSCGNSDVNVIEDVD